MTRTFRGFFGAAALGATLCLLAVVLVPPVAGAASGSTTTTVTATPAVTGQAVVFTATVVKAHGVPTGTVTFTITGTDSSTPACTGGSAVGLAPNSAGPGSVAQCSVPGGLLASASPYTVLAAYSGDSTFSPSQGTLSEVVHRGHTSTTVTSSSLPTVTGQPVTFTATVAPTSPAVGTPSGSVTFTITGSDASSVSCDSGAVVPLTGDVAACPVSGGLLAAGTPYTVTAAYSGDANFAVSTATFSQSVNRATATIAVAATPSTASVVDGQPVSFTATIAVTAPGTGTPTGSVVFAVSYATPTGLNSTTELCQGGDTVPLAGLSATCSFPSGLRAKWLSYTVTATLSDPNFKTPVSGSTTVAVSKGSTVTTLYDVPGSVVSSQGFAFGALVTTAAPSTGSAQGVLEWAICPDPLPSSGVCTGYPGGSLVLGTPTANEMSKGEIKAPLSVPGGLKPGFYSIDANYQGDSDLLSSSSTNSYLTVDKVPTTLNVFANHNPLVTGGKVVLRAAIIADPRATSQLGAPSGTVTFTITGESGDTLTCDSGSTTVTVSTTSSNQGVAKCEIAAGQLTQGDQPYTVAVSYPGSADYEASTSSLPLDVLG